MELVKIYIVCLQTLEAFLKFSSDAFGLEVVRPSSFAIGQRSTLREDVNLVASSLDRLSDNLLCSSPAIEWGSVYPVHAEVNCCLDGSDCYLLVLWSPVDSPLWRRANGRGPDSNLCNSKTALSQTSGFQNLPAPWLFSHDPSAFFSVTGYFFLLKVADKQVTHGVVREEYN